MTGRIFEAGHTTAPDHMPERAQDSACIKGGVHTRSFTAPWIRQFVSWLEIFLALHFLPRAYSIGGRYRV
jgi:hypothetical protein